MTDLPPYSGRCAQCPKYETGVSAEWHVTGGAFAPERKGDREYPCKRNRDLFRKEHLCRICQNCGYGWVEACADSKGEPS